MATHGTGSLEAQKAKALGAPDGLLVGPAQNCLFRKRSVTLGWYEHSSGPNEGEEHTFHSLHVYELCDGDCVETEPDEAGDPCDVVEEHLSDYFGSYVDPVIDPPNPWVDNICTFGIEGARIEIPSGQTSNPLNLRYTLKWEMGGLYDFSGDVGPITEVLLNTPFECDCPADVFLF